MFQRTDQKKKRERLELTQQGERLLSTVFTGNFHGGNYTSRCPEGPGEAEGSSGHQGFLQGTCFWEQASQKHPLLEHFTSSVLCFNEKGAVTMYPN